MYNISSKNVFDEFWYLGQLLKHLYSHSLILKGIFIKCESILCNIVIVIYLYFHILYLSFLGLLESFNQKFLYFMSNIVLAYTANVIYKVALTICFSVMITAYQYY